MFSEKQIKYMKNNGIVVEFINPSDDELFKIEEVISTRLQIYGFDKNYEITEDGLICEEILDLLAM
ncbi:MAG: hypothetical protein RSE61_05750 [Anaerovoracaceae bacterium]